MTVKQDVARQRQGTKMLIGNELRCRDKDLEMQVVSYSRKIDIKYFRGAAGGDGIVSTVPQVVESETRTGYEK
jgi:2-succinyl-5-enolpyruvyl-6-hydroxy-3-cyclohexene-1-carboxylate synthase